MNGVSLYHYCYNLLTDAVKKDDDFFFIPQRLKISVCFYRGGGDQDELIEQSDNSVRFYHMRRELRILKTYYLRFDQDFLPVNVTYLVILH